MPQSRTRSIGLDIPKASSAVAYGATDHDAEVSDLGTLGTRHADLDQLIRQLQSTAHHLVFVDEAGPCGSWLDRDLTNKGYACRVVAPALMPGKAGDRGQTDRREAGPLARLLRSGDLTTVDVPALADAASRDLTRAREEAIRALKAAKSRRQAFLLRHDLRSRGQADWGPAHWRWLREVVCPTPAQHIVSHEYVRAVSEQTARLQRLAEELQDQVQAWRLPPVVDALQALRGVQCTVAVTTVAELGDLTRVENPRQLLKSWGLIPAAYSSGERRRQGAITTAGNTHARRALGEGAWA